LGDFPGPGGDRECVSDLIQNGAKSGTYRLLPEEGCKPWFDRYDAVKGLAQAWFEGPQEQEKVKSELAKYGLTAEAIVAQTYVLRRDELAMLHRLVAAAEARRDTITRNFNEYRAMSSLGQKPVVEVEQG
jgi:hypothetical protein